jgi:2-polyprenyl-3-methyl-5-hydroxy-6-metoxy-1,4-benzoquinol methylase
MTGSSSAWRTPWPTGYHAQERPDVLALVPNDAVVVLDCGCGEGWLGRRLRDRGCRVTGIEREPHAAAVAACHLDRVLCGTLETFLPALETGSFDCVVCADVLEHLADPWAAVLEAHRLMRPGGALICSAPNIRHLGVLVDLVVRGRWSYAGSGVLDRTHLRFFTRQTLLELLTDAGFRIDLVCSNDERFSGRLAWLAAIAGWASREFRVAQWRVRAVRP